MKNKKLFFSLVSGSLTLFSLGWFFLYQSFYVSGYKNLYCPIFLFLLAFITFYFFVVIEKKENILFLVFALGMLGSVFLSAGNWISGFFIWFFVNFSCLFAIKRIKTEQYNRININVYRILKRGIPIIGTVFTFLISVSFYFSVANLQKIGEIPRFEVNLPIQTTRMTFEIMNTIAPNKEIKWISEGVTVDEYFRRIIYSQDLSVENLSQTEIQTEGNESLIEKSNNNLRNEVLEREEEVIANNREILQEKLEIELNGEERIDEVLHSLINKKANDIINGKVIDSEILPIGGAFALFITVRSVVWISNMFLFWTVYVIFSILIRLGMIKIKKERREVESFEI